MSASQLAWRAGQQFVSDGSNTASQLPFLQLSDADLRSGSVRVVARAPSGRTQALNIHLDANGQYKTDFVPNEVGDWLISILYDGNHIQGSPFSVRVHDPNRVRVFGLQNGGSTGKEVTFSVDTTGAGEGELTVEVIYLGRAVATRLAQQGNHYQAAFLPEDTGSYHVYVFFARMHVPGSPFLVNVANPAVVTADGEGLTSGKVNHRSSFVISTAQDTAANDVAVQVKSPTGSLVPANVTSTGSGLFSVDFTPTEVGDHNIDVLFHNTAILGSPFICKVCDISQIIVTNLHGIAVAGKPFEFGIDANEAGNGKMEIMINDGQVPSKVENTGFRQYRASFTPTTAGPHVVQIRFNGHEIEGSPWTIEAKSADGVHTTASQLHLLPINRPASFEVHAETDGHVQVKVLDAAQKLIPACITRASSGVYLVEFTPSEIGPHSISVTYEDVAVPGGPHVCYVYDASAVTVGPVTAVAVCETAEFTVDVNQAGPGELTIIVNGGSIPATARMTAQNIYIVSFVPTEAGLHSVELYFNDQPLKDCPIVVPVVDTSLVTLQTSSPLIPVGQLAVIKANTQSAGPANLTARIMSPSCREVVVSVHGSGATGFLIEFTPNEPGAYEVIVEYGGQCLPCSPLLMAAYDINRVRVMGIRDSMTDCPGTFVVDLNKCGEGELDVCILSTSGRPVLNTVTPIEPGRLEVSYTPTESGHHFAEVTFNDEHVPGSPFKFNVLDVRKVKTRGDGLTVVECNQLSTFILLAPEAKLEDIDVLITGPTGRQMLPSVVETKPFTFQVDYTPTTAGIYQVDIHYHGCGIPGSPFSVQCWDASRVLMTNIKQCEVGCESFFNIEMVDAGDGTIEISIAGPNGQLIPNEVVTVSSSLLEVHFVPTIPGNHRVNVAYNGTPIPGSPAQFNVVDPDNVSVRGEGLGLVQCSRPAVFSVCAPTAQLTDVDIAIIGPDGKHVIPIIKETSKGNFRVEYIPVHVGTYAVRVACFGKEVISGPFIAKAWDASRVLLADVAMGQVGVETSFKVIVADAGEGVLEVTVTDPTGHLTANQAAPVEPGVLEVIFTPKSSGIHRGNVVFNREKVPGSPFTFQVIDVASVTCWGDGLTYVPVRKPASFTITAPQAQMKDINVRMIGPAGGDVMTRLTESGNRAFRVDYTPLSAGAHLVNVFYYGKLIPACPLTVHVWDISKVLVSPINLAFAGIQSQFTVDAQEAGEGKLEVVVTGPQGQHVNCELTTDHNGAYLISLIPAIAGFHRTDVTYNGEVVPGSPFTFTVADPESVSVNGQGVDVVRCKRMTSFVISSPAAKISDLHVKITGPSHKREHHRIFESGAGLFTVEYTPSVAGEYSIVIKYFDHQIKGSPFTAHAWDPAGVVLTDIKPGVIGRPYTFSVNAANAGSGSLEISVNCRGETIPNLAQSGQTGTVQVSFTPKYIDSHHIHVQFNGELVPGSPFIVPVIDGSLATASGPGLGPVPAHKLTKFHVSVSAAGGDADLITQVTAPSDSLVQSTVEGFPSSGYTVTYTPHEAGRHSVHVKYADVALKGSPFSVDVFDPSAVIIVGHVSSIGRTGKPFSLQVDTSRAGQGTLTAEVKGHTSKPGVTVSGYSQGLSALNFIPVETGEHLIFVSFNGIEIPGEYDQKL